MSRVVIGSLDPYLPGLARANAELTQDEIMKIELYLAEHMGKLDVSGQVSALAAAVDANILSVYKDSMRPVVVDGKP